MNLNAASKNDLLSRLEALVSGYIGVPYREFQGVLKECDADISLSCLHRALNIACDQLGFWQAEWLFSQADSPNYAAKAEMEGWEILWRGMFDILVEKAPSTRHPLEEEHSLKLLQHSLHRGIEYNKRRFLRKTTAPIVSKASFLFNKIGLHRLAAWLYEWALFPKGTVARP